MVRFGYTLMTEQAGPNDLVRYAADAEAAGFDFEVSSDHFFPWLDSQGHAPNAWVTLGAVSQVTDAVELMTYVTCPTFRYHPVVVAQQAATLQLLSQGRFTLGLGSGENLNEHVVGEGWPSVSVRHDMLVEAVEIISGLFTGEYLDYVGEHYRVDRARLYDVPDVRPPIGIAVSGKRSVSRFAPLADHMIAVQPEAELVRRWDRAGGSGRKIGQIPICWDPDREAAVRRAHDQFRWFGGGWKVNAELPGPPHFAAATGYVSEQDVAEGIPCGPDVEAIVEAVSAYWKAGFTDIALVQIGGDHQDAFFGFAEKELLPALREASNS